MTNDGGKSENGPKNDSHSFLDNLILKACDPKLVTSYYSYFTEPTKLDKPYGLTKILGLEDNLLSETAKSTLGCFEKETEKEIVAAYQDFKWKLLAFIQIQDILTGTLYDGEETLSFCHQWYFFYESKYILIESILCSLNGFYLAANSLLRLFLEFSLLQNYYFRRTTKERSFRTLEQYFDAGVNPSWNTIMKSCMPRDNFTKPIRKRISLHLEGLSKASAHPYHPQQSPKHSGSFAPEPSLQRVYSLHTIARIILEAALWIYYVNFPMLFHPVDILKKFGFKVPVGVFIDEFGGHIIKKSLSEDDHKHFLKYSKNSEQVSSLLDYYHSREDMTDDEIMTSWDAKDGGEIRDVIEGYCKQMANLRALKEVLALKPGDGSETDSLEPGRIFEVFNYDIWKDIYKKSKKR